VPKQLEENMLCDLRPADEISEGAAADSAAHP